MLRKSEKPKDGAKRSFKVFDSQMSISELQAEVKFLAEELRKTQEFINSHIEHITFEDKLNTHYGL